MNKLLELYLNFMCYLKNEQNVIIYQIKKNKLSMYSIKKRKKSFSKIINKMPSSKIDLTSAIISNNEFKIRNILKTKNINLNELPYEPLILACYLKHTDSIKVLLESNLFNNKRNKDNDTALTILAENFHEDYEVSLEIFKLFLNSSYNLNIFNSNTDNFLNIIFKNINLIPNCKELIDLICKSNIDINNLSRKCETPLINLVKNFDHHCNIDDFSSFLKQKPFMDTQDFYKKTAIMYFNNNNVELIKYLINNGANINIKDNNGKTLFFQLVEKLNIRYPQQRIIELLIFLLRKHHCRTYNLSLKNNTINIFLKDNKGVSPIELLFKKLNSFDSFNKKIYDSLIFEARKII